MWALGQLAGPDARALPDPIRRDCSRWTPFHHADGGSLVALQPQPREHGQDMQVICIAEQDLTLERFVGGAGFDKWPAQIDDPDAISTTNQQSWRRAQRGRPG
jgi:hypothetical protein